MMATTSQRQGRRRETGSEGSPRQNCDLTDRKVIRGRVPGTSQHQMAKSSGSGDTVKDPGVQREFTFLSGETCLTGGPPPTAAGLRPRATAADEPPDPPPRADHPMDMTKNAAKEEARFLHPIVRTHPETGRKALYLDLPHVERLENMSVDESQPLMEFLYQHGTQPQFTARLRWRLGTLVVWDNRCVQHYALNDYAGQRREMNRITVQGDVPY